MKSSTAICLLLVLVHLSQTFGCGWFWTLLCSNPEMEQIASPAEVELVEAGEEAAEAGGTVSEVIEALGLAAVFVR